MHYIVIFWFVYFRHYLFTFFCFLLLFKFFLLHCVARRILLPQPEMEPAPPAVEAQILNHWTARAAAAAAKSLQSCPTLCDPTDGSHQAPPSLGFSRQEHWSGLPFPSPVHESAKWRWSCPVVCDSSWPQGLQPTRLLRPWDFPGKRTGVGATAFSGTAREVPLNSYHERYSWLFILPSLCSSFLIFPI